MGKGVDPEIEFFGNFHQHIDFRLHIGRVKRKDELIEYDFSGSNGQRFTANNKENANLNGENCADLKKGK